VRVGAAVGEHERQPALRLPQSCGSTGTSQLSGDAQILAFAQREVHLDRIELGDSREQRLRADEVANLGRRDRRDAIDEGRHPGEADIELGGLDCGLCRLDGCLRRVMGAHVVVELTLRNRALLRQRAVAGEIALSLCELRAALREVRARLRQRALERPPVDLEEDIPPPDPCALAVVALDQVSGHLRPDLGVDVAIEGGEPLASDLDAFGRHGHDADGRGGWRRRRRGLAAFSAAGCRKKRSSGHHGRLKSSHVHLTGYPTGRHAQNGDW
jgi:hypothetical protein